MRRHAALTFAALVSCCGCDAPRVVVEGRVTWGGRPVEEGSISFDPADRRGPGFGGTITAGRYRAESQPGTPPGVKAVKVRAARLTGRKVPASPTTPNALIDEIVVTPARYASPDTPLTAELKPGANTHDIDLPAGPAR